MSDIITAYAEFLRTVFPGYLIVMAMHIVWGFLANLFLVIWHHLFGESRPEADKIRHYVWRAMLLALLPAAHTARLMEVNDFAVTSYIAVSLVVLLHDMVRKPKEASP